MKAIKITKHAYLRAKERLSLNSKSLDRLSERAFYVGIRHSQTKGYLKKYITKLWFDHLKANNIRLYGENVFFFVDKTLITVYQLPSDLKKYLKCC